MPYRFLTFELDPERRELLDRGRPVPVSPKVFDVLAYLIAHRDRMVPKQELLDRFWAANVSESALQKTMSQVRKALGGESGAAPVIRTHHGLGFRFAAEIAAPDPPAPAAQNRVFGEQRLGTVLCVRLAAGPQQPASDRAAFPALAREIVERHRGGLLNMMADGFTAAFGLDAPLEDTTRRAVYCARALAAAAGPVALAAGIDTGLVDAAPPDADRRWTLPGAIERGAMALAETGGPGDILLSSAARDQLRSEVETVAAGTGFRLVSAGPMRAGIPARPRRRPTRFVGRAAEMAFLAAHLAALGAGTGQAVTLSGPAGIGKTRLVSEFVDTLDPAAIRTLRLQCLPGLCDTPMAPIRDLCRALFPSAPPGTVRDATETALYRELLDDTASDAPALQALSDHARRQTSCALLARMLDALCRDGPLVLVFEDVHWIDATSREYLDALLDGADRRRLMVLLTSRPGPTAGMTGAVLTLSPLGDLESLSLLRGICHEGELGEGAADTLVRRAAGNPFFIEELALAAQTGGDPAVDLPDTVQAVTAVRIGVLDPALRVMVYVIAVAGPPVPAGLVARILGQPPEAVEAAMQRLIAMGFVQAEPGGYGFRHMLINDTAYALVAPAERTRLHAEIARDLESDETGPARPERLAWHFQEAGETDRAISYWIAASRAALYRSARHEAIAFARKGLALIGAGTREAAQRELDLQLCLAPALTALRGFGATEVGQAYARAQHLSHRVGTPRTEVRVQVGLWIHSWVRGRLTDSLGHAARLLDLSAALPDPALCLQAHASRGQVLLHTGDLDAALDHLATGLRAIDPSPPTTFPAQNAAVSCAAYAAWTASMLGREAETLRFLDRSRQLSAMFANPFALAIHHALCAEPMLFRRDLDGCLDHADRAIALSREHDFAFWLGTGLVLRGWALGQREDEGPALDAVSEGIAVFEATGAGVQLANWYGLKAEILLALGRPVDGIAAADHALACAARAEDVFFTPRIHATAARLHDLAGRPDLAAPHRDRSAALARRMGMPAHVLTP